ncbi:GNAT family N-acetyltransferase [Pantoea sp. 1.19]|uniref:GNAT family N-acetyltransferase n=1 Tax=Pantoea sp. 1.19 TaxID=1925589 RepID=UPI000948DDCE|nr:GNAT family N-acetyltransferase [Pantoea sp. 1.19]
MTDDLLAIRPWRPGDSPALLRLILPIQTAEFGLAITAAQQPDLQDVAPYYLQGDGGFWLALAGGEVVGCIALKDIGDGQGALRKLFVAADWRGGAHGVAARLLTTLLDHARRRGLRDIWLGTTAQFLAAQRFYRKHGFTDVAAEQLPVHFPRMQVDSRFFRRTIAP